VLYADTRTGSMERALAEMSRRRVKQLEHNRVHGITPRTIEKAVSQLEEFQTTAQRTGLTLLRDRQMELSPKTLPILLKDLEAQMKEAADNLDFELAAILRDQLFELKGMAASGDRPSGSANSGRPARAPRPGRPPPAGS
jgi:excinuclease ABC subunit B